MLLVIPEIQIRNGESIYSINGEPGTENFYENLRVNLFDLCRLLRTENSKSIIITDLDGLEKGCTFNFDVICMITPGIDIPVQVLSGFGSIIECEFLLDFGVQCIYLTDLPLIQTEEVKNLINRHSYTKIGFYINDNEGYINFNNYKRVMPVQDYIEFVYNLGGRRFYYENENWTKDKSLVDYEYLSNLASQFDIKFNVANTIVNVEHLWQIAKYKGKGIGGAVICEPLFFNHFVCQKIWRLAEADAINKSNLFNLQNQSYSSNIND